MKKVQTKTTMAILGAFVLGFSSSLALADDHMAPPNHIQLPSISVPEGMEKYGSGDARSGYIYATEDTRVLQDDDFENPSFLWVETAQDLWGKVEGDAGKSCQSCHGDVESLKGAITSYPKFDPEIGELMNVETRINRCRSEGMQAKPWKWESDELLGMTALVKMQSRGLPMNVSIDGPARPYFERGLEYYGTRVGQMDLACKHCHEDQNNNYMRAELLSQGQPNGFPTYRLKWQKLGSLHRRFRGCNDNIRAAKLPAGSPTYMALELYLSWRANGLPVESPSVRK